MDSTRVIIMPATNNGYRKLLVFCSFRQNSDDWKSDCFTSFTVSGRNYPVAEAVSRNLDWNRNSKYEYKNTGISLRIISIVRISVYFTFWRFEYSRMEHVESLNEFYSTISFCSNFMCFISIRKASETSQESKKHCGYFSVSFVSSFCDLRQLFIFNIWSKCESNSRTGI